MNRMVLSTTDFVIPSWLLLLLGICLGQSRIGKNAVFVLDTVTAIVNVVLIPIYTVCVVAFLMTRAWRPSERRRSTKHKEILVHPIPLPTSSETTNDGVFSLSGSYKLIKNDNFDGFLEIQGVPWALRRAADAARPTHTISHIGKTITIRIQGIIESQTTYEIDGPLVETNIRGRIFRDQMTYLESGDGIRVSKEGVTEDYNVETVRRLSSDKMTITMTSKAIFKDDRGDVVCVQLFERIQ